MKYTMEIKYEIVEGKQVANLMKKCPFTDFNNLLVHCSKQIKQMDLFR
jgi:hypothetical protein